MRKVGVVVAIRQKKYCERPGCKEWAVNGPYCEKHLAKRTRSSSKYRSWYSLKVWELLRQNQLSKSPLCAECLRNDELTPATVVDHINPHRGNWESFVDQNNLQSLCKHHHDSKTAREDGGFGNRQGGT